MTTTDRFPASDPALVLHAHGEPVTAPRQLVKGMVPAVGVGVIEGDPGTGKTFLALDLAGCVATGLPFAGRRVREPGGVLYVAAEGVNGFPRRLDALDKRLDRDAEGAPMASRPRPICWTDDFASLADRDHDGALIRGPDFSHLQATVDAARAGLRSRHEADLRLVVLDSVVGMTAGLDWDSPVEVAAMFGLVADFARDNDVFVFVLDALGVAGDLRSAAGLDVVWRVTVDGEEETHIGTDPRSLTIRKNRDGEAGLVLPFRLLSVPVGVDEDGDETTSLCVAWSRRS